MKNRKIFISDDSYYLCKLMEEDKEDYMKLLMEVNTITNFYDSQTNCDIMWKIATENKCEFSIFNKSGSYCGNIMLKYPESEHPEIGIDIVGEYRNQGIAPRVIKMFARKNYEERPVEYYVLRVSSKNLHSKHIIEKLGAVPDDSEDLFFQRVMCAFKDVLGEESYEKAKEEAEKILSDDDEEIYQYRYLPDSFLE